LEAQAKKMYVGTGILAALLLTGGVAAFHGGLFSMGAEDPSARSRRILTCEGELAAVAATGAIGAIDDCVQQAQEKEPKRGEPSGSAMHTVTVKFDYDFTRTPLCGGKIKDSCVSTFTVYDISGPKAYKLFSIPAPANAKGMMKGIKATSPRMLFGVGRHRIGVSAVSASGKESPPIACDTIVEIGPNSEPAAAH
jgi:hypothetical protein